jgi:hypothetical protein
VTREQQYFYRVAVEHLRLEVAQLHFEAIRENLVMPAAWCDSLDRELSKFMGRLDEQVLTASKDSQAEGRSCR